MSVNWMMQRVLAFRYRGKMPAEWGPAVDELAFSDVLTRSDKDRLVQLARMFDSAVSFDGRHDFEITDRVRRLVSLQACRLILNLGYEPFRYVHRVTVAPTTFVVETGGGDLWVLGAEHAGHIALSWNESEIGRKNDTDGRNVIYHEFAHVLDRYDGTVDGRPDMEEPLRQAIWTRSVTAAFHRRRKSRRKRELIDEYATTSPAEFFAEVTEVFFERPDELHASDQPLYEAFADYYQQDPVGDLAR
ncbi:MAG: Mlc titration factor MtfA (ptsG expression regulator) [Candidatus Aldehydirespiratoraceae bacterium]|jgi:Mlc titration factor MtfA (ptsG expression regulator)